MAININVTIGPSTAPPFAPDVWTDITPPAPGFGSTFGCVASAFDPNHRSTLYCTVNSVGLYKSTDWGTNWSLIGSFTNPVAVSVDPADSNHIIVLQGVAVSGNGFWVSQDGGVTWNIPAGFSSVSPTLDVTTLVHDPDDWNHILVGSHSAWSGFTGGGVLESSDGGTTWTKHDPVSSWPAGSIGIGFLTNSTTWLVMTDGDGFWKTSNSGTSWNQVSTQNQPHGAAKLYRATTGKIYSGGTLYPLVSSDEGDSWAQLTDLGAFYYFTIFGDGTTLYTGPSFPGTNGASGLGPVPFFVSAETDGVNYDAQPGGQAFINGPAEMHFDSVNSILYAPCWGAGFQAMLVS